MICEPCSHAGNIPAYDGCSKVIRTVGAYIGYTGFMDLTSIASNRILRCLGQCIFMAWQMDKGWVDELITKVLEIGGNSVVLLLKRSKKKCVHD